MSFYYVYNKIKKSFFLMKIKFNLTLGFFTEN